jgi:hypothetical protein
VIGIALYDARLDESVGIHEKSEESQPFRYCSAQGGFPMRASNSSVGGAAGKCDTTRWAAVMVSADGPSQSVSLTLCDGSIAAQGRLRP